MQCFWIIQKSSSARNLWFTSQTPAATSRGIEISQNSLLRDNIRASSSIVVSFSECFHFGKECYSSGKRPLFYAAVISQEEQQHPSFCKVAKRIGSPSFHFPNNYLVVIYFFFLAKKLAASQEEFLQPSCKMAKAPGCTPHNQSAVHSYSYFFFWQKEND